MGRLSFFGQRNFFLFLLLVFDFFIVHNIIFDNLIVPIVTVIIVRVVLAMLPAFAREIVARKNESELIDWSGSDPNLHEGRNFLIRDACSD
jgi:hypothetical protein